MPDDQINAIMPPPQQAQPLDPLTENMNAMQNQPLKAGLAQDHQAHIEVHKMIGDMPAMQAHIAEHLALKMRVDVERVLGIQLPPPGAQLPPEVENQIAVMVAQAVKLLEAERGGPDMTAEQIAARDLEIKAKKAEGEFAVGMAKVDVSREKIAVDAQTKTLDRESKEEIELVRATANIADNQNPDVGYVRDVVNEGRKQTGV